MTYGILDCFMISAVCGVIFGVVYEFLRLVRRMFRFDFVTFICDILFFVLAGLLIVRLSMYLGSYIRMYTILGFACGVFAYIQTFGRIVSAITSALIGVLNSTVGRFVRLLISQLQNTFGAFAHKVAAQFGRITDFVARSKKKHSSPLHFDRKTLYNIKREKITIGESSRGNNVIKAKIKRSS